MIPIKSVLLDVDGTLVDSNDAHANAWVDAFLEAGFAVDYQRVRPLIGMGGDHLIKEVTGFEKDEAKAKALEKRRGEIFRTKYLPDLKAFPEAGDLLRTLKSKGYHLVITTSASAKDLKGLLAQTKLDSIVDFEVTATDADSSKPDPDIILAALKKGNLKSQATILLGDTPYDIEAAGKAGVKTVAFACGGWSEQDLKEKGALKVYQGPAELLSDLRRSASPF